MAASKTSGIPAQTRASKALDRREHYQGYIPLAQLKRLAPMLAGEGGELRVELQADRDRDAASWVRGAVRGVLPLTCQRGLHPFEWSCDLAVALRLVFDDAEADRLLKDFDPYLVLNDQLPLREMVEDEVLLALPMMPRCDDPNCLSRLK